MKRHKKDNTSESASDTSSFNRRKNKELPQDIEQKFGFKKSKPDKPLKKRPGKVSRLKAKNKKK